MNDNKQNSGPRQMNEQELNQHLYEKRMKNFTLNISENLDESFGEAHPEEQEVLQDGSMEGFFRKKPAEPTVEAISSFSDPTKAKAMETGVPTAAEKAAAKKAKAAHKQRNSMKRKNNRRFFRGIWVAMVIMVSIALGQYLVVGVNDMLASNRTAVNITLDIPKDPTVDQVAEILKEKGAIDNVEFFKLYCKLTKAEPWFRLGTFQIDTGMDYQALVTTLQSNASRLDVVSVTFREGMSVPEVAELMEEKGVCEAKEILALCESTTYDETYEMLSLIPDDENRVNRLEGYLFPDTYQFYIDEDPQSALKKLIRNCNLKLTTNIREKAAEKGLTIDELLTLASIVQIEAANEEDMYKVSSVLQNRLANGATYDIYTLDCDSTTYYPYRKKIDIPSSIRETYVSPYNTYQNKGLPPGPICSPSSAAIDAVLNPADTGCYYFCHSADGTAYYASTLSQHQENLIKAGLAEG